MLTPPMPDTSRPDVIPPPARLAADRRIASELDRETLGEVASIRATLRKELAGSPEGSKGRRLTDAETRRLGWQAAAVLGQCAASAQDATARVLADFPDATQQDYLIVLDYALLTEAASRI